jgi:hypothetical protein
MPWVDGDGRAHDMIRAPSTRWVKRITGRCIACSTRGEARDERSERSCQSACHSALSESARVATTTTAVDESLVERDLTAARELEALRRQVSDLNLVPATTDGHPAR